MLARRPEVVLPGEEGDLPHAAPSQRHAEVTVAGLPQGAVMAAADLAEFHGVSASYLLKHLKALVKADLLVESQPVG